MKLISSVSGGKDSVYAFWLMLQEGFEIRRWVTFVPRIKESYMLHSLNTQIVEIQAKLSGVMHKKFFVTGEKEEEIKEMLQYLKEMKESEAFEGLVCGAVMSEYQKHRFDMICEALNIPCYAPLWHKNSESLLKEIVENGFEFIVTYGGDDFKNWVGEKICKNNIEEFIDFLKDIKANISGEGGEYETFVVKTPFWEKEIKVMGKIIKEENVLKFVIDKFRV